MMNIITNRRTVRPYETLTSRQQFYIDQEWFLKLDEAQSRDFTCNLEKADPTTGRRKNA